MPAAYYCALPDLTSPQTGVIRSRIIGEISAFDFSIAPEQQQIHPLLSLCDGIADAAIHIRDDRYATYNVTGRKFAKKQSVLKVLRSGIFGRVLDEAVAKYSTLLTTEYDVEI